MGLSLGLALFSFQESDGCAATLPCSTATTLESLVQCVTSHMPRSGSNKFVPASLSVTQDWQAIVRQMLQGSCDQIPISASLLGKINIRTFRDSQDGKNYCVLLEIIDADTDGRVDSGYGTFIVNNGATRELNHAAPHALTDYTTELQAVSIFKGTNSRSFLMTGAPRDSNSNSSACQRSYLQADAAHNTDGNLFFAMTQELNSFYGSKDWTQIQWHAMAASTCPGVNAYFTYGVGSAPPLGSELLTLKSKMKSLHPTWLLHDPGTASCSMTGGSNTEGLFLNNVSLNSICQSYTNYPTQKFIHIEQQPGYRAPADWIAAVNATWPSGPSPSPSPTSSPTPSPSPSISPTPTPTLSPSPTPTPTPTLSPSPSPSPTLNSLAPRAPTGLVANTSERGRIRITWNLVPTATGYTIKRSRTSGGPYSLLYSYSSTTYASYTSVGLPSGATYFYVVSAKNAYGESPLSSEVRAVVK